MYKKIFLKLFKKLSGLIKKDISKKIVGENSKGQKIKYFDKFIEKNIISFLKKNLKIKAEIVSEELNKKLIINNNKKNKKYYIIIDPVDGSDNYIFNIPFICLAIAIFDEKFIPVFSFVGNYFTGDYIVANKNKMWFGGKTKKTNQEKAIFFILSGIKKGKLEKYKKLLLNFKHIRALGTTAGEMMLVANGAIDSFIDLRGKLTLENFAPYFLISKYTKTILTDENGNEIKITDLSLSKGYNIIFSKNKKIHNKIKKLIN